MGLVFLKVFLDVVDFYCEKENFFVLEEEYRIRLVGWVLCEGLGWWGSKRV